MERRNLLRKGQALVMVTFALLAIVGFAGLAIDFSYAYFLEKTMQVGADAAALATVQSARETAGSSTGITCGNSGGCLSAAACTGISSGAANAGCLYAVQNGFARSEVTMTTGIPTATVGTCGTAVKQPPTAPCVSALYYATARISRRVPQLFSAILGNTNGGVSARATAAMAEVTFEGSLIVINRNNDMAGVGNSGPPNGNNVSVSGGGTINVPGGIILGSDSTANGQEAGQISGNASSVVSPWTWARAANVIGGNHSSNWVCATGGSFCPPTVKADSSSFYDPMHVKAVNGDIGGQPPIYGAGESAANDVLKAVPGGILTSAICPGGVCPPGIYYATAPDNGSGPLNHPSGVQIRTANNDTFTFGTPGVFQRFVFVGGLSLQNGTTATMNPGRYVFAGAQNASTPLFQTGNGVTIAGGTSANSDAGRVLIFTDFRQAAQRNLPVISGATAVNSYANQIEGIYNAIHTACGACVWNQNPWNSTGLPHGSVDFKAGNGSGNNYNMYGLNSNGTGVPTELQPYGNLLLWQDQHNSYVRYKQNGTIDTGCGTMDSPCRQTPAARSEDPTAPMLSVAASPTAHFNGIIYQPRGAWTALQGSGVDSGPLQIISGAITLNGSPAVTLTSLSDPLSTFKVALVE